MTQPTVGTFDFGKLPAQITMELVEDWQVALFATGQTIQSDTYVDEKTGEPTEGYVAHIIARNPDTREVLFSDPTFPSVVWQVVLKRVAQRSIRLQERGENGWALFVPRRTSANKSGRSAYVPIPVTREEDVDDMRKIVRDWMLDEVGLRDEDALSELAMPIDDVEAIEVTPRQELTGS